jgi:hypothetical protein
MWTACWLRVLMRAQARRIYYDRISMWLRAGVSLISLE